MNIFVCVKQVPDTETKIKLAGNTIDGAGVKWVMNPYDEFAVEESLKLKAANPTAQIWAVTVGPKARTVEVLRTALAMGADEAICVDAPEALDNYSTALALSKAIQQQGDVGVVYTGRLAIDDNSSAVTQMLAEFLGVPHSNVVSKAEYAPGSATIEREADGGNREVVQLTLPSVIGANKGLNAPRYPSLPGIMKAKKKVIKELALSALGITGSDNKVKVSSFELPPERPPAKLISGDVATQTNQLVKLLREEAKII